MQWFNPSCNLSPEADAKNSPQQSPWVDWNHNPNSRFMALAVPHSSICGLSSKQNVINRVSISLKHIWLLKFKILFKKSFSPQILTFSQSDSCTIYRYIYIYPITSNVYNISMCFPYSSIPQAPRPRFRRNRTSSVLPSGQRRALGLGTCVQSS